MKPSGSTQVAIDKSPVGISSGLLSSELHSRLLSSEHFSPPVFFLSG
jgi:hypothetical protein